MRIGLIDVDGHNFPNLALMRISAYHKSRGDIVEWWWTDIVHYDIVYKSKVFSDTYSPDVPDPINADQVIKGGTGYQIHLVDGREVYDTETDHALPPEIESMPPDYSIYHEYDFAVSMTSRGCPRGCPFCHVGAKEGRCSVKVADVSDMYKGQKHIVILDPNITACADKRELFSQYKATGATLDFSQGLDIRLLDDDDLADINSMRIKCLHFAWDNPAQDLSDRFAWWSKGYRKNGSHGGKGTVYCLTNFEKVSEEEHIERALHRVYKLREMNFAPYIMIYQKTEASQRIKDLARWVNNPFIFWKVPQFEDYVGRGLDQHKETRID